jgi:hypothetical protein
MLHVMWLMTCMPQPYVLTTLPLPACSQSCGMHTSWESFPGAALSMPCALFEQGYFADLHVARPNYILLLFAAGVISARRHDVARRQHSPVRIAGRSAALRVTYRAAKRLHPLRLA